MNRIAAAAVLTLLVSPVTLLAQTLADKVPADAIVYAGFKGSDALSGPYAQSHLKGLLPDGFAAPQPNRSQPHSPPHA